MSGETRYTDVGLRNCEHGWTSLFVCFVEDEEADGPDEGGEVCVQTEQNESAVKRCVLVVVVTKLLARRRLLCKTVNSLLKKCRLFLDTCVSKNEQILHIYL